MNPGEGADAFVEEIGRRTCGVYNGVAESILKVSLAVLQQLWRVHSLVIEAESGRRW